MRENAAKAVSGSFRLRSLEDPVEPCGGSDSGLASRDRSNLDFGPKLSRRTHPHIGGFSLSDLQLRHAAPVNEGVQ